MTRSATLLHEIYEALLKRFGPQNWWPAETRTEMIIGAILTQNTNWKNVERALANLRREGLLDIAALHATPIDALAQLIRPARLLQHQGQAPPQPGGLHLPALRLRP